MCVGKIMVDMHSQPRGLPSFDLLQVTLDKLDLALLLEPSTPPTDPNALSLQPMDIRN